MSEKKSPKVLKENERFKVIENFSRAGTYVGFGMCLTCKNFDPYTKECTAPVPEWAVDLFDIPKKYNIGAVIGGKVEDCESYYNSDLDSAIAVVMRAVKDSLATDLDKDKKDMNIELSVDENGRGRLVMEGEREDILELFTALRRLAFAMSFESIGD